jgi:hypothetical protein
VQGFGDAVDFVLPHSEHCFCVRHLQESFKRKCYKEKAVKDELWEAARASNVHAFEYHINKIMEMDDDAHNYLSDVPCAS